MSYEVVDELPEHGGRFRSSYPWGEWAEAVRAGKTIEVDLDALGRTAKQVANALAQHRRRHGFPAHPTIRQGRLFLVPFGRGQTHR